jgi:poly(A) polymerase
MFFDPIEEKVIDYVHGRDDIKNKILKTIGDPQERFREDRLRLIRAVRFAHRFGFHIEENTRLAIKQNAKTLFPAVAIERVWQELKKMADYPRFGSALLELHNLGLLEIIFPELSGVSSDEVKKRVQGFEKFPDEAPAILFLMELFPSHNIDGLTAICQYLKVSNKDQKIVEVTNLIRARLKESCDDAEWAKLYAHPSCELVFHVIAARLGEVEGKDLLSEYQNKKMKLKHHIDRIKAKSPLVGSEDLIKEGIAPGKNMGLLLQEAERQSINSDVNDKTELMKILKKSDFWPR